MASIPGQPPLSWLLPRCDGKEAQIKRALENRRLGWKRNLVSAELQEQVNALCDWWREMTKLRCDLSDAGKTAALIDWLEAILSPPRRSEEDSDDDDSA
jgi:hypothetical protein